MSPTLVAVPEKVEPDALYTSGEATDLINRVREASGFKPNLQKRTLDGYIRNGEMGGRRLGKIYMTTGRDILAFISGRRGGE